MNSFNLNNRAPALLNRTVLSKCKWGIKDALMGI